MIFPIDLNDDTLALEVSAFPKDYLCQSFKNNPPRTLFLVKSIVVLSIYKPQTSKLEKFLVRKEQASLNYSKVGGTQKVAVQGYDNDHTFEQISNHPEDWPKAKKALTDWLHFPASWTTIYDPHETIQVGQTVGVLFQLFGLWWINSARIIYIVDEVDKFGFAYGTINGHVEQGEECFWIERDADHSISYHIKAFSKPDFWGARLLYPLARSYQRKFVRDSINAMKNICKNSAQ